jgi:Ran GTPase-activating protein (RanGAP) involved in mRNA processing and transport
LLHKYHSIRCVSLEKCEASEDDLIYFTEQLRNCSVITLSLHNMQAKKRTASALATLIQETQIQKLDISRNDIEAGGLYLLTKALQESSVVSFNVAANNLGTAPIEAFAKELPNMQLLLVLNVSANTIGDAGAFALAKAFPFTKLECVLVGYNFISENGIRALCEAIKKTPTMREFDMSGTLIRTEQAIDDICDMVVNTKLEFLTMKSCHLTPPMLMKLAMAVKQSMTLEYINLENNRLLNKASAMQFLGELRLHYCFRHIELKGTNMTPPEAERICTLAKCLQSKTTLAIQTMLSVKICPRLGARSKLYHFPADLIRILRRYLPQPFEEKSNKKQSTNPLLEPIPV